MNRTKYFSKSTRVSSVYGGGKKTRKPKIKIKNNPKTA